MEVPFGIVWLGSDSMPLACPRRCIAVHPTLPVFLTCSDDTLIKLWDWDKVCHPPGCCIAA